MEPIPETVRAIEELGPFAADGDLLDELHLMGRRVSALVPDCVGVSLGSVEHGVTFTLTASDTLPASVVTTGLPSAIASSNVITTSLMEALTNGVVSNGTL